MCAVLRPAGETRKPTPAECMIDTKGKKAVAVVQSPMFFRNSVYFDVWFNGAVVEGYCYSLEFALDLKTWQKVADLPL